MSDRPNLFSADHLPTIVGVAAVLSLLALALTFNNMLRTNDALGFVGRVDLASARLDKSHNKDIQALEQQVADLQGRLAKLEAAAAPPVAPPADPAAPPAK